MYRCVLFCMCVHAHVYICIYTYMDKNHMYICFLKKQNTIGKRKKKRKRGGKGLSEASFVQNPSESERGRSNWPQRQFYSILDISNFVVTIS